MSILDVLPPFLLFFKPNICQGTYSSIVTKHVLGGLNSHSRSFNILLSSVFFAISVQSVFLHVKSFQQALLNFARKQQKVLAGCGKRLVVKI
jgi:hypothetical protein